MANKVRAVMHWLKGTGADEIRERKEASHDGLRSPSYTLQEILDSHRLWLQSKKKQGAKADLSNRRIDALVNADLREADLHSANLSGTNLRDTKLERANLSQANFSKANLHGTSFREANLHGADLTDTTGLLPRQLAGADVSDARLPANFPLFTALDHVKDLSDSAQKVLIALLVGCVYCWLTIATTTDTPLLTDSASSPLPIVQTPMSIASFFQVAPLILLFVYVYLLLYLQRLWEGLADLPAIFPDGRTLPQRASSWLLNGLVSAHMFRLLEKRPAFMRMQTFVAAFLAWGIVPLTLVGLWVRALPRRDYGHITWQLGLLVLTISLGLCFYVQARATLKGEGKQQWYRDVWNACNGAIVACLVLGLYLHFFLIAPPRCTTENFFSFRDLRHSVTDVLLYWGTANIKDADVSTKPPNWSGTKQEEFLLVKGARLARRDLTCARASRAFLANADLQGAQLACADLSEANLRLANLMIADLRGASLHFANLAGTTDPASGKFQRFTNLMAAKLHDAKLIGARLQGALLRQAELQHADFTSANLQGANLQSANLQSANLQGASLWGANLAGAKFGVAKLADADLEGANLADADLEGANLAGADLQQVRGLTQDQLKRVCGDKATKLPAGLTLPAECPDLPPCFDPPCPEPPPLPSVPCPIRPPG
jgi:uncharacterized protein YjbI with pentapeptide repeats